MHRQSTTVSISNAVRQTQRRGRIYVRKSERVRLRRRTGRQTAAEGSCPTFLRVRVFQIPTQQRRFVVVSKTHTCLNKKYRY